MGLDVFKRRCAHRILSRLEQCEDCLRKQRNEAVAKAGPREPVFYNADTGRTEAIRG